MERKKQIVSLYFLTVLVVLILIFLWEFQLEAPVAYFFGVIDLGHESATEHWKYVKTVTIFTALAMLIPFIIALKLETERSKVQAEVEEKELFYRTIIEDSTDVTLIVRENGEITYASPSVLDRFGYTSDYLVGKSVEVFLHSLDAVKFMARIKGAREVSDKKYLTHCGTRFVHNNGEMVVLESIFNEIPNNNERKSVVINCRDVTERMKQEERIKFLAFHDNLTALPNRRTFSDRLTMALEQAKRDGHKGAVLFLDIDNFKNINDTLGHDAGDEILKKVAYRLKVSLRKEDTVSRLGGDEFTCLLPKIHNDQDVEYVANKILNEFKETIHISDKDIMIGISIGGSLFPSQGYSAEELIKKADNAMYYVKGHGKGNFHLFS